MSSYDHPSSRSWSLALCLLFVSVFASPLLAQTGISGTVVRQSDRQPLAGVEVVLVGTGTETTSGADGRFELAPLEPGSYAVEARRTGFVVERQGGVVVLEGELTEITLELTAAAVALEEIVVTPSQFSLLGREPAGGDFLTGVQIDRMPHLSDDLFRAVGSLPGVTGGDISAKFHVRGGEQEELLLLVDGVEVYEPFHLKDFQSVFSVIDSEAVGGLDFYTGAFPAEYGDRMSGVLDITTASAPARRHTEVGVSFINARLLSQGTIGDEGDGGEWLVSARRGYLDIVLDFVDSGGEFDPTYYDALAKYQRRVGERSTLSGNLLVAYDDVRFDSDDDDERADATYGNGYAWLNYTTQPSDRSLSRTVVSAGRVERERKGGITDSGTLSVVRDDRDFDVFGLRQDLSFDLGDRHFLKTGLQAHSFQASYDYFSRAEFRNPLVTGGGPPITIARDVRLEPDGEAYGLYVSDRIRLANPLTVELGVRWDRQTYLTDEDDQVSPRLNLAYQLGQRTSLRAGWGRFYQSQRIHELQVEDGVNNFFAPQRSEHQIVALEHAFPGSLSMRVEAYRKEITDVRPRFENLFDVIALFPEAEADRVLVAPERAEAEGVELTLRRAGAGPFSWWMSYGWSSAEDRIDGQWVPRSWDQEHAFRFSADYRPGEVWNFNLSGVYHTGWPTTAVSAVLGTNSQGNPTIVPVLGPRNGENYDAFHKMDFRASRRVTTDAGNAFTFFLEVFNLYNRENPCCVDDFDFAVQGDGSVRVIRTEDHWLPIIPSFGFAWEF